MAVGQNQWYHLGVVAPPILVYFSGDWDVHWFDPWPYEETKEHSASQGFERKNDPRVSHLGSGAGGPVAGWELDLGFGRVKCASAPSPELTRPVCLVSLRAPLPFFRQSVQLIFIRGFWVNECKVWGGSKDPEV